PADLGIRLDATEAVDAAYAVGRTGGPVDRLSALLTGMVRGQDIPSPGFRLDKTRLLSYLEEQARQVDRPAKDAELSLGEDLVARVSPAVVGRKLDVSAAASAIERAIADGAASVELPIVETQPKRTERDLEAAKGRLVKILSAPVSLEFAGRAWSLSSKELASMVSIDLKGGTPETVALLKEEPLQRFVKRIAGEVDQPKVSARFDWNGGNLKQLRAGQDGRKVDQTKALSILKDAISGEQRVAALPVEVERAAGSSVDPATLGIKERIEFGRTTIAGVPEKQHNVRLAASRLNGVLLAPGDVFSFNRELGPTTLKSGFQTGFGIAAVDGEMQTVPSVAGGICQVATTLIHAVFRAGYQIEERYPHMYWIASYGQPPSGMTGLDATVDDPVLDFKFVNNTQNYLLIQSSAEGGVLEFQLYGTRPSWKVEIEGPIITNVVKADPEVVRQEEPSWPEGEELWVESATDGMDVEIVRRVTQGSDVRTLRLESHYLPSRNVLMVGTKKQEPAVQPAALQPAASQPTAGPSATGTPRPITGATTPTATPAPTSARATQSPTLPPTRQPASATPTPRPTASRP
ncbi:MAG: VanW family protein, partial [Dehalococcoidales bacterium]|nr:VanW family protein [Dehalococcoidales bacterium]